MLKIQVVETVTNHVDFILGWTVLYGGKNHRELTKKMIDVMYIILYI